MISTHESNYRRKKSKVQKQINYKIKIQKQFEEELKSQKK